MYVIQNNDNKSSPSPGSQDMVGRGEEQRNKTTTIVLCIGISLLCSKAE